MGRMSALLAVLFGLSGAIVYGAADFFGGISSRRLGVLRAGGIAAVSGLVVLLAALPVLGGRWSPEALGIGALAGIAGGTGLLLLYACLAIGPMSVLSPLTALVSAVVPMGWGLLRGERIGPIGSIGLALALIAVALVALVPERTAARATPRAVLMALGSGTMIGVFLVLLDATPDDSGLLPLVANRVVGAALMGVALGVALLRRREAPLRNARHGVWLALVCGALDGTANALLLAGVRTGDLTVMSVLTALYPAGTIVLAALVLRERITALQAIGLVLALAAAVLLALG
jgi:uncharacterized membrane protein